MIPVHNSSKYLGSAIQSVLAQSFTNFELIVHDDASTDDSLQIARSFQDPRLKVIHTSTNHGMIGGWNYLFRYGKGKYFKQMGSDDLLHPNCLQAQVDILSRHPRVALVTSARQVIDASGRKGELYRFGEKSGITPGITHAHWILTNIRENKIGEPVAVMFPSKLLVQSGLFDPQFSQFADFEMWLRLLANGDLAYINEPLCQFRQHAGSNTTAAIRDGRFITEIFLLIKKYYNSPRYRQLFALSPTDRRAVIRLKTLDTLKNIKDLGVSGHFRQSAKYLFRLVAGLSSLYT